jgi:hypothetical protein
MERLSDSALQILIRKKVNSRGIGCGHEVGTQAHAGCALNVREACNINTPFGGTTGTSFRYSSVHSRGCDNGALDAPGLGRGWCSKVNRVGQWIQMDLGQYNHSKIQYFLEW